MSETIIAAVIGFAGAIASPIIYHEYQRTKKLQFLKFFERQTHLEVKTTGCVF